MEVASNFRPSKIWLNVRHCRLQETLAALYRKVGHIRETDESALQASSHGLAEARLFPAKSRLFAVHLALRADSNYVANLSVGYGQTFL